MATVYNYEEADAYRRAIADSVTRELVGLVFGAFTRRALTGETPATDFDALFFVKTLEAGLSRHDRVAAILHGGTILWPEVELGAGDE